jgi:hypothetical protein
MRLEQFSNFLFEVWIQFPKSLGGNDLVAGAAPRQGFRLD